MISAISTPLLLHAQEPSTLTEFCLNGEFDLGTRYQGLNPSPGEFTPTRWCVVTDDESDNVLFATEGRSNPDVEGHFTVSYLPPDRVRIVNQEAPPDIEFVDAAIMEEAMRYRRIEPRRLVRELESHPEWVVGESADGGRVVRYPGAAFDAEIVLDSLGLRAVRTQVDLPLRGRVHVGWMWRWEGEGVAAVSVELDGTPVFRGRGDWRTLTREEAAGFWEYSGGEPPGEVPGYVWPSLVSMRVDTLAEGIYFVRGVRTGFNHLVVDTEEGLVVGDAPAGWVELAQIPPADLAPGLGVSGLSERFVDFLAESFPGRPIRAVAVTHAHDDHAGGARAFAAAGGAVYAPQGIAGFLETAFNRPAMPPDRFGSTVELDVIPVESRLVLDDPERPVELIEVGSNPHSVSALGVWVPEQRYFFQSDLHVAVSDTDAPREGRAQSECWFAGWATSRLPPDAIVLSSHSAVETPVTRLAAYLESEVCAQVTQ